MSGGTQVYHHTQDSLCLARDANQEPPEYKYRVISGFRPEVDKVCALLGYYEVYRGISLPTFQGNLSGLIAKFQEIQEESCRWARGLLPDPLDLVKFLWIP